MHVKFPRSRNLMVMRSLVLTIFFSGGGRRKQKQLRIHRNQSPCLSSWPRCFWKRAQKDHGTSWSSWNYMHPMDPHGSPWIIETRTVLECCCQVAWSFQPASKSLGRMTYRLCRTACMPQASPNLNALHASNIVPSYAPTEFICNWYTVYPNYILSCCISWYVFHIRFAMSRRTLNLIWQLPSSKLPASWQIAAISAQLIFSGRET